MPAMASRLKVGSDASEAELRNDWVAIHEMTERIFGVGNKTIGTTILTDRAWRVSHNGG